MHVANDASEQGDLDSMQWAYFLVCQLIFHSLMLVPPVQLEPVEHALHVAGTLTQVGFEDCMVAFDSRG